MVLPNSLVQASKCAARPGDSVVKVFVDGGVVGNFAAQVGEVFNRVQASALDADFGRAVDSSRGRLVQNFRLLQAVG